MTHVEIAASIYSVVTSKRPSFPGWNAQGAIKRSRDEVTPLLYGHSELVDSYVGEHYVYHVMRTTSYGDLAQTTPALDAAEYADNTARMFRLANSQCDRLLSGLHGAILAGSKAEADELIAECAGQSNRLKARIQR